MKRSILFFLLLLFTFSAMAQTGKYWVFLKNKKNVTFDPYSYFDKKTIERRIAYNIPLLDSTDFPLNEEYVNTIVVQVDSVSQCSRWFNAMAVYANEQQIEKIKSFSFVKEVEPMMMMCNVAEKNTADWDTIIKPEQMELMEKQLTLMGGDKFEKAGIDGKGIRIAIFDGGFPTVNTSPIFEHIRKDGRILKTWDFTKNRENVYAYISHGTSVMSCIAGMINGRKIGLATGAEFLLARTEVQSEPFSEEENWLAAVEWADKNGADIINSSLGYTYHRYFQNQMDGKTSLVARAANLAAKKGMLVVNAAGNDGDNDWKVIGTPADADSVLSVGGIDAWTKYHISYSSFGPTTDKRMKPNVCAVAHVIVAGKNGLNASDGTSFASPLIAGFAACAWQKARSLSNMQLFNQIEKSANLYPYFDYAHGYGVPQASYFTDTTITFKERTFTFDVESNEVNVNIKNFSYENNDDNLLYYNIQKDDGVLLEYNVLNVSQEKVFSVKISDYKKGYKLNVHYNGYTDSYSF